MDNDNLINARDLLNSTNSSNHLSDIIMTNNVKPIPTYFDETKEQIEKMNKEANIRIEQKELREIRNLEIDEERLELDKFKVFLLQSVNRDQKEVLEKIESLIDIALVGNKTEEANLAIIQEELNNLKMSTDNLNESFIELIKSKMVEKSVEIAISYFFIGLKTLFLPQT